MVFRKTYSIHDDQDLNVQTYPLQIPMSVLYASRDTYANYPPFQREQVWNDAFKFELIDSYVKGLPVAEIQISDRLDGGPGKWILDGQQRMSTLLQYIAALHADKAGEPIPTDEEGKPYFYFRLTERQEQLFFGRMVKFTHLVGVTDEILSTMFLRVQNQIPLSIAERLYATSSAVNKVTREVCQHSYFSEIYTGKTKRRQPFHAAVYPVVCEMYKPFCDLNSSRLQSYMRGSRDYLVTYDMSLKINRRLDAVLKLFHGVQSGAKSELIIQYQAIWLLEFCGADFERTAPGALVSWYRGIEQLNSELRQKGFLNLFASMVNNKTQREYWRKWLEEIVYSGDIAFPDQRAAEVQLQRVTGWLRHNGVCPECNNNHVQLFDIAQHVFRPADAHNTARLSCITSARQLKSIAV